MNDVGGSPPLHVAIIGGGITGLSAAYHLGQAATEASGPSRLRVTVYERAHRLGGKVRTEQADGFLVEAGPDCFLVRKPWMAQWCRALGLGDRLVPIGGEPGAGGHTGTYVLVGGRLHRLPLDSFMGVPFRWTSIVRSEALSWPAKVRLALEPLVPRRRGNGEESLAAFARRRLGYETAVKLVEPLLAGISGGDAEGLGVESAFPALAEMERRYGSLLAGAAALMERVRANGGARRAAFETVDSGLYTAVEAARAEAEKAGVTFRLGTGVKAIVPDREGEPGSGRVRLTLEDGEAVIADAVILTVPASAAARMLREAAPAAACRLQAVPYASSASVYFGYRRADVPHPLDGTGYITARDEARAVRSCTWVSSKWPHSAAPDYVLIRCHMGPAGGEDAADRRDGQLIAEAREEMHRVLGITAPPVFVRVYRWQEAIPQYAPGHRERIAAIEDHVRAVLPAVHLAGAAYRGFGLPDCVRQGKEAAEAVVAQLVNRTF